MFGILCVLRIRALHFVELIFSSTVSLSLISLSPLLQALCSQTGVFSPDWQVDQDQTVLEGGAKPRSCSGPSEEEEEAAEEEVEPCRPPGVMRTKSSGWEE